MSRIHLALFPLVLMAADCGRRGPDPVVLATTQGDGTPASPEAVVDGATTEIRLSDADGSDAAYIRPTTVQGRMLSAAATAKLLDRLEPLDAADVADVAIREKSQPPPRPGREVDVPFPPPSDADTVEVVPDGPLEVLRWRPDGDVPVAPKVSITFDRPMVPLTTQDRAAAQVPVVLSPEPEGQWRWVGTRTLLFEPPVQLPRSTRYALTVPPGTTALDGSALDDVFSVTFELPRLTVRSHVPSGVTDLQPVVVLTFDQDIDRPTLIDQLELVASGAPRPFRAATSAEIEADPAARNLIARADDARWVAIVPAQPLPKATGVSVVVPKGVTSAEGPLPTEEVQTIGFQTYRPLEVVRVYCRWNDEPCRPGDAIQVEFNQALERVQDLQGKASLDPTADPLMVYPGGNRLVVQAATAPNTTYTLTLDPGLRDAFGQETTEPFVTEVEVGPAEPLNPWFRLASTNPTIPDPFAAPSLPVLLQGMDDLRAAIHEVDPTTDWRAFQQAMRTRWDRDASTAPGTRVGTATLGTAETVYRQQRADLDLSPYAPDGHGMFVVELTSPTRIRKERRQRELVWVVATHLGLDVVADADTQVVVVTDLRTGAPVGGAEVSHGGEVLGTTNAQGLLRTQLPSSSDQPLVARKDGDATMYAPSLWNHNWSPGSDGVRTAWFVFSDRGLYRPGEEVHVKGWRRRVDFRQGGDLLAPDGEPRTMPWTLTDAQRNELATGEVTVDRFGGFDLTTTLPGTPNLGNATFRIGSPGDQTATTIDIQEFRRPTFEVSSSVETSAPHVEGDTVTVAGSASYFAGGTLPGASASWSVTATPGTWRPAGWDGFRFGAWTPPWYWRWGPTPYRPPVTVGHVGTTDSEGTHRLAVTVDRLEPPQPTTVRAQVSIQDVDRQTWSSASTMLVHPARVYVGAKTTKPFYAPDEDVVVQLVAVDLDGEAVTADVTVKAVREIRVWTRGAWATETAENHTCEVTTGTEAVTCAFRPEEGGRFQITATVHDVDGRRNLTKLPVWVQGGEPPKLPGRVEQQRVTLVPDAEQYQPGDVARILVQAPFAPAYGLVTWRRSGLLEHRYVELEDGSATVEVPIDAAHVPNLSVQVDLYGAGEREGSDTPQPAYAVGRLPLDVPPLDRALTVEVVPEAAGVAPGVDTSLTVRVTDADGDPVSDAQVALIAVDESVLALSGHTIGDPLTTFHPQRSDLVYDHHNRRWISLVEVPEAEPESEGDVAGGPLDKDMLQRIPTGRSYQDAIQLRSAKSAPSAMPAMEMADEAISVVGMAEVDASREEDLGSAAIAVRSDFRPDALFAPDELTGADGTVTVAVDLPDNLTRYRLSAVVVDDGKRFGTGESDLTVRLPLMVRPAGPRFLNFGDRAQFPVTLQNQTDDMLTVQVAMRASNATVDGGTEGGRQVQVPPNDRVEVRLPVATVQAGEATFQVAAATTGMADAATVTLPVWTPATQEAFATYEVLDGPKGTVALKQPMAVPGDVYPQIGGLQIGTSTTQLSALTDAFIYLSNYPFDCNEQRASRLLAILALRDVLEAFDAEGLPPAEELEAQVERDLDMLRKRQNLDGSWGYWRFNEAPSPWVTLHAAHAVVRAKAQGYDVSGRLHRDALSILRNIDRTMRGRWWTERAKDVVRSQALMIRQLAGDDTGREAGRLYDRRGLAELPMEALGWLLPSLDEADDPAVAEILRHLATRAEETASTAQWTTGYSETEQALLLHSSRRTDAVLLDALLQVAPDDDLLPKIVAGLLGGKVKGRWGSTQENSWVLLALHRYFVEKEGVTPDLVARAWIGDAFAGEHAFRGRTTDIATLKVPMSWLAERPTDDLVVAREGAGRLYVRMALDYAPKDLDLDPADRGFTVERTYEAVDDPEDVWRDDDGVWHVKAGTRVRARLTMVADARRYHVALVDPLPAGLEPINSALQMVEDVPPSTTPSDSFSRPWWWGRWYDHENLRDERVEAFTQWLWAGVHTYEYVARATVPGEFIVPPAKAEEMYAPETFGRSGSDRMIVEQPAP